MASFMVEMTIEESHENHSINFEYKVEVPGDPKLEVWISFENHKNHNYDYYSQILSLVYDPKLPQIGATLSVHHILST
jgi:hypothetical protein